VLAYRDAIREVAGETLRRELMQRISGSNDVAADGACSRRLAPLLLAAELETALEDASHVSRRSARALTDACAWAWWTERTLDVERWQRELAAMQLPTRLGLKRPEGYAYYALDPAAYARATAELATRTARLSIIGVRSIGTSLSAVACAAARSSGAEAERTTVRPEGHAWERRCSFRAAELEARLADADYLVVDEGPGLSGSTFLSVAEGLEAAGVAPGRITLLVSHEVQPARLVARDAARRWSRFRASVAPSSAAPGAGDGAIDVSAGRWRPHVFGSEGEWPFVWQALERRKILDPSRPDLIKFVGLPPYGEAPLGRARALADAGFSPSVAPAASGYLRQRWLPGRVRRRPMGPLGPGFVERLVEYLAIRSRAFVAPHAQVATIDEMMRQNVREALAIELPAGRLELRHGVYADARLAPHEWLVCPRGILKLDGADHGDDHGYPGPCDTAWDLAGAIIELGLSSERAESFLTLYRRRTGDDARARLRPYLVAYVAERVGRLEMAALSSAGRERSRLDRELAWYRARLSALLGHPQRRRRGLDARAALS
jgi:hypothetical protein